MKGFKSINFRFMIAPFKHYVLIMNDIDFYSHANSEQKGPTFWPNTERLYVILSNFYRGSIHFCFCPFFDSLCVMKYHLSLDSPSSNPPASSLHYHLLLNKHFSCIQSICPCIMPWLCLLQVLILSYDEMNAYLYLVQIFR